jgi:hypothetical protein
MLWTIAKVKSELRSVSMKIGRKVHHARISGRLNEQATVTVSYMDSDAKSLHDFNASGRPWVDYHYSWDTIANSLNNNRPLKV